MYYTYIMWKWKYSLRYMNSEGQWQEHDTYTTPEDAIKAKEALGNMSAQVVDLEDDTIVG